MYKIEDNNNEIQIQMRRHILRYIQQQPLQVGHV